MANKKKMIIVKNKRGQNVRLLRPGEKSKKFSHELKNKTHFTNFGQVKVDSNGVPLPLTDTQKAYRSGYLTARKDQTRVYNAKRGVKTSSSRTNSQRVDF